MFTGAQFRSLNTHLLTYVQGLFTQKQLDKLLQYKLLLDRRSILIDQEESVVKERIWCEDTKRILARYDWMYNFPPKRVLQYYAKLWHKYHHHGPVIISDYQKGSVTQAVTNYVKQFSGPFFVDTKNPDLSVWEDLPDCYVKINADEYHKAYNHDRVEHLIVTAGADGAYYYHGGEGHHFPTWPFDANEPMLTVGAGDVFIAAFATNMLKTNDVHDSIRYANIAARAALRRIPQNTVFKTHIEREISNLTKESSVA